METDVFHIDLKKSDILALEINDESYMRIFWKLELHCLQMFISNPKTPENCE